MDLNLTDANPTSTLQQIDIFNHLSSRQIEGIERISIVKRFCENEMVFYEGDESVYFHFLLEGEVSIIKSSALNETIAIHRFRAPSMIAEMAVLRGIPYPASAECLRPCVVLKIKRDEFIDLISSDPSLSITLIASLASKISVLEQSLQRHSAPNAISKVSRLILEDPESFSNLKGVEIAQMLGITPETLSRTIKKLKEDSIISVRKPKGLTIIDPVKLQSLSDNNFPLRG